MRCQGLVCLLLFGSVLLFGLAQDSKPEPEQQNTTLSSPEARPDDNSNNDEQEDNDEQETEEEQPPAEPGEDAIEEAADAEPSPENPPTEADDDEAEPVPPAIERSIPEGADPEGFFRLTRDERRITVNQYAPKAEGGEFILNAPNCNESAEQAVRTTTVYGADKYWVETLVNDTRITSAIALMRKPDDKEIKEQEVLELFGGSLTVSNETKCPEDIQISEQQDVKLIQGRTTVDGYRFVYDNQTGVGKMTEGPVKLNRVAEGDSPALTADADELEYSEESDETKLFGNVIIESDGRTSNANSVDFDDANSIAILRGSPARSEKDGDVFEGNVITYFLDSNDVRVEGNIVGDIEVDLGDDNPSSTTSGTEESNDFDTGEGDPNDPFQNDFEEDFDGDSSGDS